MHNGRACGARLSRETCRAGRTSEGVGICSSGCSALLRPICRCKSDPRGLIAQEPQASGLALVNREMRYNRNDLQETVVPEDLNTAADPAYDQNLTLGVGGFARSSSLPAVQFVRLRCCRSCFSERCALLTSTSSPLYIFQGPHNGGKIGRKPRRECSMRYDNGSPQ